MIIVEEHNQDALSRVAGCYLYSDTKIWIEDGVAHREDGPAVIFPDGVVRWYLRGKEVTRAVNTFFYDNKWAVQKGLDTDDKLALFREKFVLAP
jgi:hypothetical protein